MKRIESAHNSYKLTRFFIWLRQKIAHLFEPEEVEVTFKRVGNQIHYTYTKVEHKQVA